MGGLRGRVEWDCERETSKKKSKVKSPTRKPDVWAPKVT
jgi:hypothetical protein